ncbi:hypothetical protein B1750_gp018 [Noumeavirus]|uniref:hypothetical protein n=1 Tax=Noumeavirus TaxID=1955558 RepID=UPI000982BABE|nr:hypothetical protein B1750_gp018 [Noumeavirus]AQM72999.1 hypothetical protein NMV_018 [Noumeavirus]
MQVPLKDKVSEIIKEKYFLRKNEFVVFEKNFPNDPFTTLFTVYTKWSNLLCEWEELKFDDTIGYYKKGQLGLSLTQEEILDDIRRQLFNCKELNGIHKGLLEYELGQKKKIFRKLKRLEEENARLRRLVSSSNGRT